MYNYRAWGSQAQPQLPLGWEAKWDAGSRRWFYIDHNTRTTHWELPKVTQPVTPTFQPRVEAKASFVTSLKAQYPTATDDVIKQILINTNNNFIDSKTSLESMGYRRKVEVTPDPKLVKQLVSEHISVSQTFAESLLRKHNNDLNAVKKALGEKGYQKKPARVQPLARHVTTLEKEYPDAGNMVIKDVLISSNNSIVNAHKALERMGYKKVSTVKKAAPKAELSEATKQERITKLKKRFPDLNERLIKMSLEGTRYDLELAASLLQMSINSVEAKSSNTKSSGATDVSSTSNVTESTSFSSSNFEPVVFGDTASGLEPVVFGGETSFKSHDEPTSKSSTTSSKSIPKPKTYTSQKPQNKTRVHVPAEKKKYVKKTVPSRYTSQNRCTPTGPNPSLVVGPNLSLLQESMIKPLGPDPTIRCGHQASNHKGPNPDYVQGSAGLAAGPLSASLLETVL